MCEQDAEELECRARKQMGEEAYAKALQAAQERDEFGASYVPDGLDWPAKEYPREVPALTRAVAAGIIARQIVESAVVNTVMGAEAQQMRNEFNIDMRVFAVAERGPDGSGRMLLSNSALSFADIGSALPVDWQPYAESSFTEHIDAAFETLETASRSDGGHGASKVMVECSGPERDISKDLWAIMSKAFESWLSGGFHVCFADADDTQLGQYVLTGVLTDLEEWEALADAYDAEEEEFGLPTEPFQEGRLEGVIHEYIKQMADPPITETKQDLIDQHTKVFGVDPVQAARVKQSRVRAGGLEAWEERDTKSANRIGVGRGGRGRRGGTRGGRAGSRGKGRGRRGGR